MDFVVIARVEVTVRSITGSSGRGLNSVVQNQDPKGFSASMEDTLLMMASSRTDLNINRNRNDEARFSENFEDGDFLVLWSNYELQTHAHHNFKVLLSMVCIVVSPKNVEKHGMHHSGALNLCQNNFLKCEL